MTVSTTLNKISYAGDGVSLTFTFPFAIPAAAPQSIIQAFVTTSVGVVTQLTLGTQYTVTYNSPIAPNPTPVGGQITLNATVAVGSTLTILRVLSETQQASLANQGALYQPVIEGAVDSNTMLIQQLQELLNRQFTVAVSDPTPTPLPPAAQRAFLFFGFDGSGNPIAANPGGATTPVSSAMAPVVAASTIAAAVALLGLSGVAPEPTGTVKMFAGSAAPAGYVLCAGQAISRAGNAALFAVIGTTYGIGDGSTTFNVPDLRGRVVFGLDNMNGVTAGRLTSLTINSGGGPTTLGGNGGVEGITQTVGMMPSHAHTYTEPNGGQGHAHLGVNQTGPNTPTSLTPGSNNLTMTNSVGTNNAVTNITINAIGGGTLTPQVQPSIGMNAIIKT